jgi:DNA (cytosine-5)-methyltransferase 1
MKEELKTLDLFAGVGGIRLGFEKAGFKTVFANDFSKNCKKTYDLNFTNVHLFVEDIKNLDLSQLPNFDILLGGFPCQPFSIAGNRQGFKDDKDRGNLFFRIAEILKEKRPKAIFLENVKNLRGHDNGNTFRTIKEILEDLGYHLKSEVLNGMSHGNMPQNRERIFIVGFLDKNKAQAFDFPEAIPLKSNFRDFLNNKIDKKYYYNDKALYEKIKEAIKSEKTVYQWRRKYVRANKKGVCPTLTANMGRGGHNVPLIKDSKGIRKLTPKECFSLQGFPNWFRLPSDLSDSELYHQAGNSVIVPVVERIADNMMKVLSGRTINKQISLISSEEIISTSPVHSQINI